MKVTYWDQLCFLKDHNYGQQPPLTPPLDGKKPVITPKTGKENTKQENSGQTDQEGDKCERSILWSLWRGVTVKKTSRN